MSVKVDLGELVDQKVISLQTGPFGSQLHSYDYVEQGVPVVPTEGIQGGRLDHSVLPKISPEKADELARHRLKVGDVLFARRGAQATGRTARVRLGEADFICGTGAILARVHEREVLDPDYFAWFLLSPETVEWIREQAIGATMPNLNAGIIKRISLPLPILPEQREIAGVLGALDDKIEANRKASACLEEMARALYRSWFVTFDPVHAKSQNRAPAHMTPETAALFPDRFGENGLPEGWEMGKIEQICERITSGGTPKTTESSYWNGGIPWLSSGETRDRLITATEKTISQLGVDKSSTRLVRKGACVIASAGQGKTRGQTSLLGIETYVNQSVIACEANLELISDEFIFFDLERRYEEMRAISDANSSRGSLSVGLIGGLGVVVPDKRLVDAFSSIVGPMMHSSFSRLTENQTLATLRDTLLPRLMSGTLRVKAAEAEVEAVL